MLKNQRMGCDMTERDRITKKHYEQEVDAVVNAKAGGIFPSSPHAFRRVLRDLFGFLILFDDFDASSTAQDCVQK